MAWLYYPDSDLPEGMTDLLRITASPELLEKFAENNNLQANELSNSLFNFIEKVMLNEKNTNEKILGADKLTSVQCQKYHYQLLSSIYDPASSKRENADKYLALITTAHQEIIANTKEQEQICFSEHRRTQNHSHVAVAQAQTKQSYAKTAVALFSAFAVITLVSMAGKLSDPANPEIITQNKTNNTIIENETLDKRNIVKVTTLKTKISAAPTRPAIQANSLDVQSLLKGLETAYEQGNVDTIKPILANAPDIQDQTEKQLNDKLETLFEITNERKMVLFDFKWADVAGNLEGKGKFLSRYLLVGESEWINREGTAFVKAQLIDNELKVTQLKLENQTID